MPGAGRGWSWLAVCAVAALIQRAGGFRCVRGGGGADVYTWMVKCQLLERQGISLCGCLTHEVVESEITSMRPPRTTVTIGHYNAVFSTIFRVVVVPHVEVVG